MSFRPTASSAARKTYFEQQRELLLGEIAMSFEQVLANINKLNRSLEAVTTVGNEFSAVEALWSQFEGVMAKDETPVQAGEQGEEHDHDHGHEHEQAQDEDVQPTVEGKVKDEEADQDKTDVEIDF